MFTFVSFHFILLSRSQLGNFRYFLKRPFRLNVSMTNIKRRTIWVERVTERLTVAFEFLGTNFLVFCLFPHRQRQMYTRIGMWGIPLRKLWPPLFLSRINLNTHENTSMYQELSWLFLSDGVGSYDIILFFH